MKTLSSITRLILALLLSFGLTACGSNTPTTSNKAITTQAISLEPYLKKNKLKLLIPMYVDPSSSSIQWRKLIDFKKVYPDTQIITIVDPSNGHFNKLDANYKRII